MPLPIRGAPLGALLAFLALAASLIAGCGSGGETTGDGGTVAAPPPEFFGVDSQDTLSESDYAEMASSGVGTLRMGLYWPLVQPDDGASFDFSAFDATVRSAAANGIVVLPYLYGTPGWVAHFLDRPHMLARLHQVRAAERQRAEGMGELRDGRGRALRPRRQVLAGEPRPRRRCRSATGRSGTSRTRRPSTCPKPDPAAYEKVLGAASDALRSADPKAQPSSSAACSARPEAGTRNARSQRRPSCTACWPWTAPRTSSTAPSTASRPCRKVAAAIERCGFPPPGVPNMPPRTTVAPGSAERSGPRRRRAPSRRRPDRARAGRRSSTFCSFRSAVANRRAWRGSPARTCRRPRPSRSSPMPSARCRSAARTWCSRARRVRPSRKWATQPGVP